MTWKINEAFKGPGGAFEVNRLIGALGATSYVVGAHVFVAHDVLWKGHEFDLIAYCTAFPAGLGIAVGAIAGAVALKDRHVASAKRVADTGIVPAKATEQV